VRGLGQQIGVDPAGLEETVQLYNQSYEAGEDQEFFKPYADMLPFAEGPYFAIEGKLATDGAFGGVRVNPEMQAYRAEGGLVPGLFVTGDFASGRHIVQGNVKKQVLNDMSWALSSGFMAGTHAAEALAEI
jgi:fumarate reductase flavoprotein subunit